MKNATRWLMAIAILILGAPVLLSAAQPGAQSSPDHSPFALRVNGHPSFDSVSFKNVSHGQRVDQHTFELMAQSVALALKTTHPNVLVEVVHSPTLANPDNHLFCDQRHLYVDFWGTEGSQSWGYSLWAGCGHNDRFEWRQLTLPKGDLATHIDQLSRDLSHRLKHADERHCYQRACSGS